VGAASHAAEQKDNAPAPGQVNWRQCYPALNCLGLSPCFFRRLASFLQLFRQSFEQSFEQYSSLSLAFCFFAFATKSSCPALAHHLMRAAGPPFDCIPR
jgi:hypothetical protein